MTSSDRPLAPAETGQLLRADMEMIRSFLSALPASVVDFHPGSQEWCMKEVLGHLMEAEQRGFAGRIRTILAVDEPQLQGWDQEEVARTRHDCDREVMDLLDEFVALRQDSVELVARLSLSDLARGGLHPKVGRLTVGELLQEWVYHDQVHVRQMLANVQHLVWPSMGNSKRFYEE